MQNEVERFPTAQSSIGSSRWSDQLLKLESLVASALEVTKGSCVDEAKQVIESALQRARTKTKMLGHSIYDASVFLSALHVRAIFHDNFES